MPLAFSPSVRTNLTCRFTFRLFTYPDRAINITFRPCISNKSPLAIEPHFFFLQQNPRSSCSNGGLQAPRRGSFQCPAGDPSPRGVSPVLPSSECHIFVQLSISNFSASFLCSDDASSGSSNSEGPPLSWCSREHQGVHSPAPSREGRSSGELLPGDHQVSASRLRIGGGTSRPGHCPGPTYSRRLQGHL